LLLEFGLARSLRGLCKNENFSSRTPARREIHERNGLSSLARNITARPCETLFPPNLTGPIGGLQPSKRGVEPAFWVPVTSYRAKTTFLLRTDSTYLCTYGLAFLARPGLQDKTQVLQEKSHTCLARSHSKTKLYLYVFFKVWS
jgi:hypothetical protein